MKKIPDSVQYTYLSSFSSLLSSGLPILEALRGARESVESYEVQLKTLEDLVERGGRIESTFADAGFSSDIVALVELGNASGVLFETTMRGALRIESKIVMKRKIVSASLYPSIVLVLTLGIISFLAFYVFPKIIPLFSGREASLPFLTRFFIAITHWSASYWWVCILAAIFLSISIWLMWRWQRGRKAIEISIESFPYLGRLVRYKRCSTFFGTVGTLLLHGLPLEKALAHTSRSISSLVFRDDFLKIIKAVSSGASLSSAVFGEADKRRIKIFPKFAGRIISVGEKSGTLPESCLTVEKESDRRAGSILDRLTDLAEPVLMIIMGGSVGTVALAIIMPIYEITQQLQR